jgi:hypothetical protein
MTLTKENAPLEEIENGLFFKWGCITISMSDARMNPLILTIVLLNLRNFTLIITGIIILSKIMLPWSLTAYELIMLVILYVSITVFIHHTWYVSARTLIIKYGDNMEFKPSRWLTPRVLWDENRLSMLLYTGYDINDMLPVVDSGPVLSQETKQFDDTQLRIEAYFDLFTSVIAKFLLVLCNVTEYPLRVLDLLLVKLVVYTETRVKAE